MKILVADDDPVSRLLLTRLLEKRGCEVVTAGDGSEAWAILQGEAAPHLAILDWMMPGLDGLEICRRVRARGGTYVYVMLLTSKQEKQDIITGLESGADDYLTKPVDSAQLNARLTVGQRILDLQSRLMQAFEEIKREATHDQLTGLWNRPAILTRYHAEWERSRRQASTVAVLLADIDHFKNINDQYGHLVGDDALRQVTRRMTEALRPYDSIGRYGGEEFLLIVPNCNNEQAAAVADRTRAAVAATQLTLPNSQQTVPVTISIGGVTVCAADGSSTAESALQAADAAMYRAKQGGRNRIEVVSGSLGCS